MGSGKSTLGQALALRLDRPFVDTDVEVTKMLNKSIPEIFEELGEAVFREAEQDALSDALRPKDPIVLATGGGTPCAEGAMEWMRQRSLVVNLQPPLELMLSRIEGSVELRPMLQHKVGKDLAQWVDRMMLTRAACYGAAHLCWKQSFDTEEEIDDALASIRWRLGADA